MINLEEIRKVQDIGDVKGKRVIVRMDFDTPYYTSDRSPIEEDYGIDAGLPTIEFLKEAGAKVILIGHIGRDKENSLMPVFEYLKTKMDITWGGELLSVQMKSAVEEMEGGQVIMFENLRRFDEETANDADFAKELASLADVYVNEAFAVTHREHASIVGIPKYIPGYAGLRLQEEIKQIEMAVSPPRPAISILGGAKLETKLPLIRKFLNEMDYVVAAGALANNFYKAQGHEIGRSVHDEDADISDLLDNPKLIVPSTVVVERDGKKVELEPEEVTADDKILDAGPKSIEELKPVLNDAKFILWNGPLGYYEGGFIEGTISLAHAIAESSAQSIVGGGDTVEAIKHENLMDDFSFVSTGGGAMLTFLSEETLPGIEVLKK